MARISRRTALKSLGALAAARALPGCGSEPPVPVSERVDTVVMLMMENRSFDHAFGAMSLLEGRKDIEGLNRFMYNPMADGSPLPIRRADLSCVPDPPHSWNASHRQWNEGKNDGFVREYQARVGSAEAHHVVGYLDRSMQPASWALADQYAVCQRWFASVLTSTWPNRYYSLAAQSGGQRTNEAVEDQGMLSVFDNVKAAGKTYGVYYGNLAFSLILPRPYPRDPFRELGRFFDDAAAGTLPNFTLIEPIYGRNDDHPPAHPLAGQVLIHSVYEALASSPQWSRSVLVLTYDEHGGFFDHVPPPKGSDQRAEQGFDQLGIRVPALICGPYVKQRYVSNFTHDHTSVMAFLRSLWGVEPLTQRDAASRPFTEVFDPALIAAGTPRPAPGLPRIEAVEEEIYAPECVARVGLARGGQTGQPELEAFFDARPELAWADRRRSADQVYEALLLRAEKRGLLLRRSGRR